MICDQSVEIHDKARGRRDKAVGLKLTARCFDRRNGIRHPIIEIPPKNTRQGQPRAILQNDCRVTVEERLDFFDAFQIYDGGSIHTCKLRISEACLQIMHCFPQ